MRLSELFGRAGLAYSPNLGEIEIERIASDSRKVTPGDMYIAIRGLHVDGHDKINEAICKGATVIVAEQVRDVFVGGAATVFVENTRVAMALLYDAWYGCPSRALRIVGVTGTNGKTSVSWILSSLFDQLGYRTGLVGTVECRSVGRPLAFRSGGEEANMTTPDPEALYAMLAQMVQDKVEIVFMEVTSHALALGKCDAIEFDMALFTNLSRDHLDFHGTMEAYLEAKKKLFRRCRRALINVDDAAGRQILEDLTLTAKTCSVMGMADYTATNIKNETIGVLSYTLGTPTGSYPVLVPLTGDFALINTLMVAAAACEYGIEAQLVCSALSQIEGIPGRMECVVSEEQIGFSVLIDYAHTPDALEKLLRSVRKIKRSGRILLVFGCGGDRDRGKRREMAQIATRLADFVIITSDNSRGEDPEQIFSDILRGIDKEKPYILIRDRKEAIEYAIGHARKGDILLLAGKGHETYEINKTGRHPFDEREIVRKALGKRRP